MEDKKIKSSTQKKTITKTTSVKKKQQKPKQVKKVEKVKKEIFDYEKQISSNKAEDTFKVEKEETKKVETPKKKVDIQKVKETLNKPIYVSKKTQEEKEEEKKKKRRFIIILLLLLLFFFFLLDVDDLIIGTPLRPRLTKVDENWYKEKVVKIEEDAYTRKNLSHYLYCIRQDNDISKCEWKETYTKNVVVSQNGENYVWFKGVTEDGLVGKPSDPIKVKIDNEAIKDIEIKTEVTDTTVKVTVEAQDEESGVEDFYYKVNDGEYIKSEDENINIEGLKPGTEYEVTIKVVDKLGNEKEVTFKVTTEETTTAKKENEEDSSNTTNETPPEGEASDTTTNNNNTNNDSNDETEDKKEETTLSEMPEISLSGVPTYFEAGESYKLPTSYKLGKSGGTVKCTVNGTEYKNTSELGIGVHKIKCKAVSNTGLSVEVQKDVEVVLREAEEMIWDGWITMTLYYPANSTDWQWRLGNEEETRTGEENTGWQDYTGPITVRLTDVENVYIRYKINGEEVIIPPKGKLLVDIQPGSYSVKEGKTTKVTIKYDETADKKQYRINGGEWQNYSGSFNVPNNTQIEARVVKTTEIYDEEGNVENTKKQTNYDSVYIRTYQESGSGSSGGSSGGSGGSSGGSGGSSVGSSGSSDGYGTNYSSSPSYTIAGPIISVSPETLTEEAIITLTTKKEARAIYYKVGASGKYQKYTEAFKVNKNVTVYAYYIVEETGQRSNTSRKYISNIKEKNKPALAINLSTTKKYQQSVGVSLSASDYTSIEYSLDGEIYVPYTSGFLVYENCTVYARATNAYGTTYTSRSITNIGDAPIKEELTVGIFTTPDESEVTGLLNKVTVEIEYDSKAEKKYYKIGNGSYKEYTGPFEVEENTTITGYATSSNGSGKASKGIDFLTTGISNPIISLNTTKPVTNVQVTIKYDKNASVMKYRIGTGELLDYTGPFVVDENEMIYAYSSNVLGDESESYYNVTNIVELPRYVLIDKGSYFILKVNYPTSSAEDTREYKWTSTGTWKKYDSQGILLIKSDYKDEVLGDKTVDGVKVEDDNGNEIVFTDHYYIVDHVTNDLSELIFMRWDYAIPSAPTIKLDTTEPTKVVYATIEYDKYTATKEYKVVTPDGKETEWLPYEGNIKVEKNNTIIYARGISKDEAIGKIGSRKITNIDEISPEIEAKGNFEKKVRKLNIQIVGTDDLGVSLVGLGKGKKDLEYFQDVAALKTNNSIFSITENGIYTLYAEDKVGNTTLKEIEVTNIDLNAPNISINVLTEGYSDAVEVEIDYGDSTVKQYKYGPNGTYQNYTGTLTIKANDVLSYANEDKTLTLYAKGLDEAGNTVEVSEIIYSLDVDVPRAPVINASTGYPVITEYGVKFDDILTVSYDKRDDITNYISLDGGTTWKKYTGVEHVTSGTVMAKSVKNNSGLTVTSSKKITQPADALGINAYDGNDKTYFQTASLKYIYVDDSMYGNNIRIKGGATYYDAIFKFYDMDNNILKTVSKKVASYDLIEQIPEGTVKIGYIGDTKNGNDLYNRLHEISIKNSPEITETKIYPNFTEYGMEQGYSNINIRYFQTAVKKQYKVDNGSWMDYKNKTVRLELGQTLYVKSIDKYGVETAIESIVAKLPFDAMGINVYDGDQSTYFQTGANSYIDIDSTIRGEQARIIGYTNWYSAIYTFYNADNEVINTISIPNTTLNYNKIIDIPENAVKMSYKGGIQSGGYRNYLYELSVKNSPNLEETKVYPRITSSGINQAYNSIKLDYFKTSVKRLYKIDEGEWKNYANRAIKLNLNEVLYAKGIDKNGVETPITSYTSLLPTDAIGLNAYDGNDKTYFQTASLKYMDVDSNMYGKSILLKGGATYYNAIFRFYDSENNVLKTVSKKVASFNLTEEIPEGTVKMSYIGDTKNGANLYNRLHEISVVNPTTTYSLRPPSRDTTDEHIEESTEENAQSTIPEFISSPTISVSDSSSYTATKTVSISYPSGGYTNEYSYDAVNWTKYTGTITIDKETTVFARSVSDGEVISSSSYQITKIDNVAPSITLSDLPLEINIGDDYKLPSNYSFNGNKTGGTVKCLLDDTTEVTSTKDIPVGTHNIKCSATTGSGLVETAETNITVIDNTVPDEDTTTDNEEGTDTESGTEITPGTETTEPEKQEGEEVNEKEETTTTESTEEEIAPSTE